MYHAPSRQEAIDGLHHLLQISSICGPQTNLQYLAAILEDQSFKAGKTLTSFLSDFHYKPSAIDVISGGAYTLIQDLPARPTIGKGIPHSGPMDPVALQIANLLVGNPRGMEGLEITLSGPELRFVGSAVVAICGADMECTVDEAPFPMWTRKYIHAGQRLKIGKTTGGGCRSYLAVHGGFPGIAEYFGSKSTSPLVVIGGYQGRALASGDLLQISADVPGTLTKDLSLPQNLRPIYKNAWKIMAMVGPHDDGYIEPEGIQMIYDTEWKVSHNASRSGIRLIGPTPRWARKDGGEGGAHPSNVVEYGYPLGALNWTGDDPCIFPVDCPNFGGFVSSTTVIRADWWKLGQIKAGDTMQYRRVSLDDALTARNQLSATLDAIEDAVRSNIGFDKVSCTYPELPESSDWGNSVVSESKEDGNRPAVRYRQGGDDHLIVQYGFEQFDLNHRCRVTALERELKSSSTPSNITQHLINTVGCCTTLTIFYDGAVLPRANLVSHLQHLEDQLGDLSTTEVSCRVFRLPITFKSQEQEAATQRYMETQRPHAPYLPDNLAFVARNNAFTPDELKQIYLTGTFIAVVVGFFCGNTVSLPVDPRNRMSCPKMNPSRVYTPAGTVSWGGSCMVRAPPNPCS
jgi:urea carboxylase